MLLFPSIIVVVSETNEMTASFCMSMPQHSDEIFNLYQQLVVRDYMAFTAFQTKQKKVHHVEFHVTVKLATELFLVGSTLVDIVTAMDL